MYDVLCIGLTCCDLIFADMEGFPILGKEMACKDFMIKAGGAANTAVALARLGVKTIFSTIIGNDVTGNIVYDYLTKMGLNMSGVARKDNYRTTVSAVLSLKEERGFATYFAPLDKDLMVNQVEKYIQDCSHVHASIYDCLNLPVVDITQKYNKTLSVDTAWDETIKLDDIKHIISASDIFFTNEIEACSITGAKTCEEALDMIGRYANIAVVKKGKEGSIVKKGKDIINVSSVKGVVSVDTTGAGDMYCAGFIYGYLKNWKLEDCAKFASASGSLGVTFYGGMDEKYTFDNVKNYYNKF